MRKLLNLLISLFLKLASIVEALLREFVEHEKVIKLRVIFKKEVKCMTQTQVAYLQLLEEQRHNKEAEKVASENVKIAKQDLRNKEKTANASAVKASSDAVKTASGVASTLLSAAGAAAAAAANKKPTIRTMPKKPRIGVPTPGTISDSMSVIGPMAAGVAVANAKGALEVQTVDDLVSNVNEVFGESWTPEELTEVLYGNSTGKNRYKLKQMIETMSGKGAQSKVEELLSAKGYSRVK